MKAKRWIFAVSCSRFALTKRQVSKVHEYKPPPSFMPCTARGIVMALYTSIRATASSTLHLRLLRIERMCRSFLCILSLMSLHGLELT